MTKELTLIATTAMGLEAIAADELRKLGYTDLQVENGKITFQGEPKDICRTALWLRTAERIKIKIGEFKATSFDALFEQTKALPWGDYLPANAEFPVTGKSIKSELHSVPDCQSIVKKAIVDSLKNKYHIDWFTEDGPFFKIEVTLRKNIATILIDASGPLHKRGYRSLHGEAPIRETLAAALIYLTNWTPDRPFADPFCGSGTIPIEAALIGQNIAPGFNHDYVSEAWPLIPKSDWDDARLEVEDLAHYDQQLNILGSDIDHKLVELASHNAREAGFGDMIKFKQMQAADFTTHEEYGCMVGNPPYGERMSDIETIRKVCGQLGQVYKENPTWSFYFISSFAEFETCFGKKASKKRKLYNGRIRTDYYQYFGKRPPRQSEFDHNE
ncbi:THUMP domain-containing class I SAM-dependent RNA methyltransferase [Terrilactibacillus tamarindi]